MAMRLSLKRSGEARKLGRCVHSIAFGSTMIPSSAPSAPMVLPEQDRTNNIVDFSFELMAVPKQRISKHKRGIRNGPKFLKPAPVIIRCTVCGRVKLPHFYCCSGIKEGDTGRQS